jgi:exodeoxyribonuclease VII small subunit
MIAMMLPGVEARAEWAGLEIGTGFEGPQILPPALAAAAGPKAFWARNLWRYKTDEGVRRSRRLRLVLEWLGFPTPSFAAMKPPSRDSAPAEPVAPSYEAALQELEQLVSRLESGQLALDQLLVSYQRGAQLLAFCRDRLAAVEGQVKVLEGAELKPWSAS